MSIPLLNKKTLMKTADSIIGAALCLSIGVLDYLLGRQTNAGKSDITDIKRILVIRPGGLGDMILLLPLIKALKNRFSNITVDVICEQRNLEALKMAGLADNALAYDSHPIRFLRKIRKRTYDVSIDTEQFHNFSAVFGRLSGSPIRIGFKISPKRNLLYTHLINYELDGPEGSQFARLLSPLNTENTVLPLNGILSDFSSKPPDFIKERLSTTGTDNYAIIHPGTSSPYKLWQNDNYVEVIRELYRKYGLATILVGTKSEEPAAKEIRMKALLKGAPVVSFVDSPSLETTAALIQKGSVFIGADSGIAHLAVALGVSTVVLFGSSDYKKWGTEDAAHAIVRKPLPCSPCFIFGYHKLCRTFDCMGQITPADVLEACRRVLNR